MEKGSSSSAGLNFGSGFPAKTGGGTAAPPSPAKKGKVAAAVVQAARCQVEGCDLDLSDAKAYYSRHKVCGMHSKSPKVIVAGIEQRFCQQCSRFHQLPEFDQGKRSCRRRLAGHNERRRKPPPGPLLSSRFGSFSPSTFDSHSKNGGFVMDFSNYPTRDSWPNTTTSERNEANNKYQLPWQSNSLLQGSSSSRPGFNPGPGPGLPPSSEECYNSALSLLSNQPWGSSRTTTRGSSSLEVISNDLTMVQPSVNPGQFYNNNTMHNHEMSHDLGLGQISRPGNNSQYNLGLGQPTEGQFQELEVSRGYDSSVQHMHWSL